MKIARKMPEFPDRRPLEFAAKHECKLPDLGPTLREAWQRSREKLTQMKNIFASAPLPAAVQTIYVCGSIGRMEMLPNSDCDLVIVTDDSVAPGSDEAIHLHADIWKKIEPLGMARPKPDGIFSESVTWGQLTDRSTRGFVDEDQFIYGKRMQMLLDAQPVAHAESFRKLQYEVIDWFHRPLASGTGTRDWTPLINEVIRYWKSLEVRTTWLDDPGQWRYLNVKLRHSRQLIIAGLLCLMCDATTLFLSTYHASTLPKDQPFPIFLEIETVEVFLKATPFERILSRADLQARYTLNECYELFLKRMADDEFIKRLRDPSIKQFDTPEYLELHENAIQFSSTLNQVLREQAEKCPPHVRQALMLP